MTPHARRSSWPFAFLLAAATFASCAPAFAIAPVDLLAEGIGEHRLVLLGEMHGTREIPRITAALVARYARDEAVLLGLEADARDQARVDRFLASAGDAAADAALLAGWHWQDAMHDGRDSVAMHDLLDAIRLLRAKGADITVVLFDVAGEGERDARMARAMRSAMLAHPGARTLVLVGNVHAMTGDPPEMLNEGKPFTPPPTMGRYLAGLAPLSIVFRAAEGAYWGCRASVCGPIDIVGPGNAARLPMMQRNDVGDSWDYTLLLPAFTASPPAVGS